jgi:hypothetical protein
MQKQPFHDLKADRPDLTPPLPTVMVGLPILFYLSLVASVALGILFTLQTRKSRADEQAKISEAVSTRQKLEGLKLEQAEVDAVLAKAKDVEKWVDSTEPLMNVVAAVVNSVKTSNSLHSLRLSRSPEQPDQIQMSLHIANGGTSQRDDTLQSISKIGYQTYRDETATNGKGDGKGDITFSTTLVRKNEVSD